MSGTRAADPSGARTPAVTIGVPVYNGEDYLESALEAIRAQTFVDWECVVSDNGSTDRTCEIVEAFAARDPRFRLVRQVRNIGAVANFAALAELARGRYFAWAGHHDLHLPDWLARLVETLEANPQAVLAYPFFKKIDPQGRELADMTGVFDTRGLDTLGRAHEACLYLRLCGSRVYGLIRVEALRRVRVRITPLWDRLFLMKLLMEGDFVQVPEILWLRRYFGNDLLKEAPEKVVSRQMRVLFPCQRPPIYSYWYWLTHLVYLFLDLIASKPRRWGDATHLKSTLVLMESYWIVHNLSWRESFKVAVAVRAILQGATP